MFVNFHSLIHIPTSLIHELKTSMVLAEYYIIFFCQLTNIAVASLYKCDSLNLKQN